MPRNLDWHCDANEVSLVVFGGVRPREVAQGPALSGVCVQDACFVGWGYESMHSCKSARVAYAESISRSAFPEIIFSSPGLHHSIS